MSTPSPVITAVQERHERLVLELPKAQRSADQALQVYESEVAKVKALKSEIDALATFLGQQGLDVASPHPGEISKSANLQILLRARDLLSDGKPRPTRDIYEALVRRGQVFTAMNAVQRLSQLLSASDWFVSDRVLGWSLKEESPVAAGLPDATQSFAGQTTSGS